MKYDIGFNTSYNLTYEKYGHASFFSENIINNSLKGSKFTHLSFTLYR